MGPAPSLGQGFHCLWDPTRELYEAARLVTCGDGVEPRSAEARDAIRVNGGQIATSTATGSRQRLSATALASATEAIRPFIFQLPTIRGRMTDALNETSLLVALRGA